MAPYLWPRDSRTARLRVAAALAVLVAAKVMAAFVPFLFKSVVDALAPGDPETGAVGAGLMLAAGPVGIVLGYGLFRVGGAGFSELRDALFAPVGQQALRAVALETFRHTHDLGLRFHLARRTGGLARIIERGVRSVSFLLRVLLFSILPILVELAIISAIFWLAFGARYLGILAVVVVAYVAFTFRMTEWRLKIRQRMNDIDTTAGQRALDSLLNYETVKYFSAEAREADRYDAAMGDYAKAAVQIETSLAWLNFGQAAIVTSGLVAVMALVAREVQAGALTVGDFVMANAYMLQVMAPLGFLGSVYRDVRQSLVDMAAMFDLLGQKPEVLDRPDAAPLRVAGGRIAFRAVDFAYEPERQILQNLDLDVGPGETVGVVGASGSGKSTLARLLFRFYDVTGGAVLIDGQDIRDVTQASLRAAIGIVPQDTVLFNDTIGYNIGYGRPGADAAAIAAAARAARIHDFIASLPDGYDTLVGERGLKLSGGERQRVGIARTLLKDPPILILDEATSALDSETESGILASLAQLGAGRSVITIAHRLSTVVDADRIVVIEAGRVVEQGQHGDLLAADGRYARLWRRQQSEAAAVAGTPEGSPLARPEAADIPRP